MQRARPAWPAKTPPEYDSRLLKNSEGNRDDEWNFVEGKRQTLLYSLARDNNKKDKKNLRRKPVDYCLKSRSQGVFLGVAETIVG